MRPHATPPQPPSAAFAERLEAFNAALFFGDESPEAVLDRHCTVEFEQHHNGTRRDRPKLVAHAYALRKGLVAFSQETHTALVDGDQAAARYTVTAAMNGGRRLTMEANLFAQLAADGRMRRVHLVTRDLPVATE